VDAPPGETGSLTRMSVMHRRSLCRYAAAGALAALLTACQPVVYAEQFGLSPTPHGVPEIRLAGCPPGAWSVFLTLAEVPGHAPGPSDALWRLRPIKNLSATLPKRFLIGSVPEGWKEAVPLRRDLAPNIEYRIYVSSGEAYIVRLDFSLGDLRPGYILDFMGNLVPTGEFPLRTTC
jgi:hypothetical protein